MTTLSSGCARCNNRTVKACVVCQLEFCEKERACSECGSEDLVWLRRLEYTNQNRFRLKGENDVVSFLC